MVVEGMQVEDSSTDTATEAADESAFLSDESSFYGQISPWSQQTEFLTDR